MKRAGIISWLLFLTMVSGIFARPGETQVQLQQAITSITVFDRVLSEDEALSQKLTRLSDKPDRLRVIDYADNIQKTRHFFDWSDHKPVSAIFRFKFNISEELLSLLQVPTLYFGTIAYNYTIYLNGKPVEKARHVSRDSKKIIKYRYVRNLVVPFDKNLLVLKENNLVIHIIGDPSLITTGFFRADSISLDDIARIQNLIDERVELVLLGLYFFIGAYHLLLFSQRKKEIYNFYFGLFSIVLSIYLFSRSNYIFSMIYDTMVSLRIERISLYCLVPMLLLFLESVLDKKIIYISKMYASLCAVLVVCALFSPLGGHDNFLRIWQYSMFPLTIYIFYLVFSSFYSEWKKIKPRWLTVIMKTVPGNILLGIIILVLTAVHDTLDALVFNAGVTYTKYGFFIMVLGIATGLANRFLSVHRESERLNEELVLLNQTLEEKVKARTSELQQQTIILEEAKAETDTILANVQEGVFLIDGENRISGQYSHELETIFEATELSNMPLVKLLEELLGAEDHEALQHFLSLLWQKRLPARRLALLNPLEEVTLNFSSSESKIVRFGFNPVGKDFKLVLVVVKDITRQRSLEKAVVEDLSKKLLFFLK